MQVTLTVIERTERRDGQVQLRLADLTAPGTVSVIVMETSGVAAEHYRLGASAHMTLRVLPPPLHDDLTDPATAGA